jgi:glycosyltransferase involved in cell wall biosynthesis
MLDSLTVFYPAFNEEANVQQAVDAAYAVLPDIARKYEVIVVDDGSHDQTPDIVHQMMEKYPTLRLVRHPENRGYGTALKTGFESARMDWVFFTDCDMQFDIGEIAKLLPYTKQYPVVLGYRSKRADPLYRKVFASLWGLVTGATVGARVRDVDCAFKLICRDALDYVDITCTGAVASTELLVALQRAGCEWVEVPVSHYPRQAGKQTGAKIAVVAKAFEEMILLLARQTRKDDPASIREERRLAAWR